MLVVAFYMAGGWPSFQAPDGFIVADGAIVAIEPTRDPDGKVIAVHVRYSFKDLAGGNVSNRVTVGAGGALPGYGWENLTNSEPIKVAYHPLEPNQSVPFRAFPFWALGSWAMVFGTIVATIAVWTRKRWFLAEA
jgi:hypothetical protein